jgi:hypothetical protein
MSEFTNDKKDGKESRPPDMRPADNFSKTTDLVRATGDSAKDGLEGMLLLFRSGLLQPLQFFPYFLKSNVFILVKYLNNLNAPLFLDTADGAVRLAIFTSLERAKIVQEKNPEYIYAAQVQCREILSWVPPGNGLVMNALSEAVTFQMSPEQFQRFKADFIIE